MSEGCEGCICETCIKRIKNQCRVCWHNCCEQPRTPTKTCEGYLEAEKGEL